MGADLYLNSIFDKQAELYRDKFDKVCELRDSLPEGVERDRAQEQVSEFYSLMYEKGYYRDSYNDSSLLNKLGLSWWQDITPLLDEEAGLPTKEAEKLLPIISEAMLNLYPQKFNQFCADNFPSNTPNRDEEIKRWDSYFKGKFEKLTTMLRMSIELDEPIYCSL